MTVVLVISEREAGLTTERLALYETARARLASLAGAAVESVQYAELDVLDADVVVLSGSYDPWAAHDQEKLDRFLGILRNRRQPAFGICAGMQLQARAMGGTLRAAGGPSRGFAAVDVQDGSDLLAGLGPRIEVLTHHDDEIATLPPGARVLATSATCAVEAIAFDDRPWWGTQFHPESWDDDHPAGLAILRRFFALAGISPDDG